MSGGTYDYIDNDTRDFVGRLREFAADSVEAGERDSELRKVLGRRLNLLADELEKYALAMHAIEWTDSGDGSDEQEIVTHCLRETICLEALRNE
jgi:hypothetical protein